MAPAHHPHRGGCRQAWLKLDYSDVERVGRAPWPAALEAAYVRALQEAA